MDQPKGFVEGNKDLKWLLLKTLYGLKQSPREWNSTCHEFMISQNFKQSKCDPCLYSKRSGKDFLIVAVYVDDIISTGTNLDTVNQFRSSFKKQFNCSEGGPMSWCLGMEVKQCDNYISINQNQYISQKLSEFDQYLEPRIKRSTPLDPNFQQLLIEADESKEFEEKFPYREIVGSLTYASTGTRPDISTAVGVVSRFLAKPKKIHCMMVCRILYYLRAMPEVELTFNRSSNDDTQMHLGQTARTMRQSLASLSYLETH